MKEFHLTQEIVQNVLSVVDKGLSNGLGRPVPGQMCVEAAVCYALGMPHGDNPTCVHPVIRSIKIRLNDSAWSSKKARAAGMRRLAVLQLGTKDCDFDGKKFASSLALQTIKIILPIALSAAGLGDHAAKCAAVTTLAEGQSAAADAADAADAARAAAYAAAYAARAADYAAAYAADAADAAADAARAAAYAADAADAAARAARAAAIGDDVFLKFAKIIEDILIEMNVPAVSYLSLLS
jgi:hypothetical protein